MKGFLLSIFLVIFAYSSDKETITWLINDVPPFYINNENFKEKGFGDLTQKMIINDLKKYNHEIKTTTLERVMKDFKFGKNVCFSTWIYNSTPEIAITSIPNIYYLPLGVITRKDIKEKLNQDVISLDKLLQNDELFFGKAKSRGYDKEIEKIVEKYKYNKNFIIRTSSNNPTDGIFEMIKRNRVDYTIDYFSTLNYFNRKSKKSNDLVFIPIKENFGNGTLGSIACSNTLWGKKVINDINKSIKRVRSKNEYKEILKEWLVSKDDEENYWIEYKNKIESVK